jgi:hypothetical protein
VKTFIKIVTIVVFLMSCKYEEPSPSHLFTTRGKVLSVNCAGTIIQLLNVPENAGQDWIHSGVVYKNVVLANPFSENKSLIGKDIAFNYTKVDVFKLSQPICDLGIIGLDTLYQISKFRIVL